MTLQVIGAGFGRTGTSSLKAALELLGVGPCYHMTEVFEHPEHIPLWEAAMNGTLESWEPILGNYHSTCDWPGAAFYEALMQANPDAKILLTVRDPEKWYESVHATIFSFSALPATQLDPVRAAQSRFVRELLWNRQFEGRFEDKAYAIDVFNQHNEAVKRTVPAEKLLVFDVQQGWEPLCAFLNVAVPDQPFPRLNDRETMNARVRGGLKPQA